MPVVVDPSFAAGWFLADEKNPVADGLLDRFETNLSEYALVPTLFRYELLNLLWSACRRGRVDEALVFDLAVRAERFPFREAPPMPALVTLRLARTHHLTPYDAAYLALARESRLGLATNDRSLLTAARAEGVATFTVLP